MLDHGRTEILRVGNSGPQGPETETVLQRVRGLAVRRWPVIVVTALLVMLGAGLLIRLAPQRFTARADILLDPRREKTFAHDDIRRMINLDTPDIDSAILTIKSNALLGRVVDAAHLASDDRFNGSRLHPPRLRRWLAPLLGLPMSEPRAASAQALSALSRALRVERVGKSYVLGITVTAPDPATAARLANAVADGFLAEERDAHLEAGRRAAAFFAERLRPLSEQLQVAEDNLDRFRREHGLIPTSSTSQTAGGPDTINGQQLEQLNTRLASARAETAQAWARYDQARSLQARGGALDTVPEIVASPLIHQLREQQATVTRKEADLAARYTDGYPQLVNVRAERRDIERAIAREMARILANLKGSYDIAQSQEDAMRADVALTTGAAGLDSGLGPRLRELERMRLVSQTTFETYLAKAKSAEQQSTFDDSDVRIISPAVPPFVPSFPQPTLVLGFMGVFGIGLGLGLAVLLETLDPGFSTPHRAEDALGLPVLAAVPWLGARERTVNGRLVDPARTLARAPHSRFAEAVHAIRAGVRMSEGLPAKVILVTSATQGEGKSMIALSLAVSAAKAGQRVLVLDADLRSPSLSRSFGAQDRLGLVDMLAGIVGVRETTVPLGAGLALMPSGRKSAVAPDLFASARMERYIDYLRSRYDLVVIDAAPSGTVVDARVLASLSDRIVFVVGWRATARDLVARNLRVLGHSRKIAGIVLNKIDEKRGLSLAGNVYAAGFAPSRGRA